MKRNITMVARSKKDIEKAHTLNKKVRKEKARLRKRGPKKHSWKDRLVWHTIQLSPETLEKVRAEAKRIHKSEAYVVRKAIKRMMEKYEYGVQEKSNTEVD